MQQMVNNLLNYSFLFFAADCPVIDSVALCHAPYQRDMFVCSWCGIRIRFPGTVVCIVPSVRPPDGRQIERPTIRSSIPGKGERFICLPKPRDKLWCPNSFWSLGTDDSFLGGKAVAL